MPRPLWNGTISFGLVNIPVKLYNAVSRKTVSFNQIDTRSGSRIKLKKVSAADGSEVPDEAIVKGYELSSGDYVLLDDDELDALEPRGVATIDIEEFVDLAEIDPIFYDGAYYLAPDKATVKPYALLCRRWRQSQQGRHRPLRDAVEAVPRRDPPEGRPPGALDDGLRRRGRSTPTTISELEEAGRGRGLRPRARRWPSSSSSRSRPTFEPEQFKDDVPRAGARPHRAQGGGRDGDRGAEPAASTPKVVDLMAALEASVREAKAAR